MKYTLSAIIGVYALLGISAPASAQQVPFCRPSAEMLTLLLSEFDEYPLITAHARGASFVLTRANDGSWTLLRIAGDMACVVSMGRSSDVGKGV